MIDDELLKILACPACKSDVKLENNRIICLNSKCGLRYPIKDDIPIMLIDEAEKPNEKK
jgi:uncharacterized protein YbaR (Trm112 family)